MPTCYMCSENGSTREHVPPLSFFPENHRRNLWTVRSCPEHNNDNALDVEYVRNTIALHIANSGSAISAAQKRVIATFLHSPALFERTFRDRQDAVYNGEEVTVWRNDLERFQRVIKAIAYGVYFKIFRRLINKDWHIFSPDHHTPLSLQGQPDGFDHLREITRHIPLTEVTTPEPNVFQCAYYIFEDAPDQIFFRFIFYRGFEVHAVSTNNVETA
jgi:hypothetical protein